MNARISFSTRLTSYSPKPILRRICFFILLILLYTYFTVILIGCHTSACYSLAVVPISPYTNPVWHPGGNILGFNLLPLKSVAVTNPCSPYYACSYYYDSAGFYLMNADGTNKRRVFSSQLFEPAWSPDGHWIAFANGEQIYKMAFDGNNFDTTNIIQLTSDESSHAWPAWSPAGDSIYYDCDKDQAVNTLRYTVWKMANDGSGQRDIGNKGIDSINSMQPYCTPTNQILHIRWPAIEQGMNSRTQVYTMNSNGDSVRQVTYTNDFHFGNSSPQYFDGKVFFEDYAVFSVSLDGSNQQMIVPNSTQGYSISKNGVIAYVNFGGVDTSRIDHTHGTIWTVNVDGSNSKPFTFNYY